MSVRLYTLHDEEVGVVDIQLHRVEQVLNFGELKKTTHQIKPRVSQFENKSQIDLRCDSIDEVFVLSPDHDLPSDFDLLELLVADWACILVRIVKRDSNAGLVDSRLALLVDQFLQVADSHLTKKKRSVNVTQ